MKKHVIDRVALDLGLDEAGLSKRLDLSVRALRACKRQGWTPLYVKLSLAALLAGIDPDKALAGQPRFEPAGEEGC